MTPTKQPSARLVSLLLCMTCLLWSCENRYAEEDQPDASEGGDASKIPASPSGDQPDASKSGDALEIPDPNPITSPTPSPSYEEALKHLKAIAQTTRKAERTLPTYPQRINSLRQSHMEKRVSMWHGSVRLCSSKLQVSYPLITKHFSQALHWVPHLSS